MGDSRPDRDAIYSIESTIAAAIDRAADAWQDDRGWDIEQADLMPRWYAYAAQIEDMGRNWQDFYPLAAELSKLRATTLMALWSNLTA